MNAKLMNKDGLYVAIWKSKNFETAENECFEHMKRKSYFGPMLFQYGRRTCKIKLNESLIKELSK